MDFDSKLHQKVTYGGQDEGMKKSKLYVVVKSEYPDLYTMKSSDRVVVHILNKFNQVIHNSDHEMRELFTVTKGDLQFEGDLFLPNNKWSPDAY